MTTFEDERQEGEAEVLPRARARRFDRIEDIIEAAVQSPLAFDQTPADSGAR